MPTRLLFIGLWNFVDDDGYISFNAKRIKMQIFPADDLDVSGALRNLLESGQLREFTSDQGPLLKITNWKRHQQVSHPAATRFTGIQPLSSMNAPEPSRVSEKVPEGSPLNGIEEKGIEKKRVVAEVRPDVARLCTILADLVEGNGSKRPNIGKGWHEAARLMLNVDHRPVAECVALLQWTQSDAFWKSNILSMPKFREKYDTVRLQRDRSRAEDANKPRTNPDAWMQT